MQNAINSTSNRLAGWPISLLAAINGLNARYANEAFGTDAITRYQTELTTLLATYPELQAVCTPLGETADTVFVLALSAPGASSFNITLS